MMKPLKLRAQNSEPSTSHPIGIMFATVLLASCGEPMFENAGSPHSLVEDREACVMEIDQSPAALAYRKSPTEHPDYPGQVFEEMNRCIERKGWKQVKPQREAATSELAHSPQSVGLAEDLLGERFHNRRGVTAKIIELGGNDGSHHIQI